MFDKNELRLINRGLLLAMNDLMRKIQEYPDELDIKECQEEYIRIGKIKEKVCDLIKEKNE